jgi:hypothetical protein
MIRHVQQASIIWKGLILALLVWSFLTVYDHFRAQFLVATTPNSTINRDPNPSPERIRSACRLEPGNFALHIKIALLYARQSEQAKASQQKEAAAKYQQSAVQSWGTALANNPLQAWVWFDLGAALTRLHSDRDRFLQDVKRADLAVEQAITLRPNDTELLFSCGRYWLWRGALPNFESLDYPIYQQLFQQAITIRPRIWQRVAKAVWGATKNRDAVLASLPQDDQWAQRGRRWLEKKRNG